MPNPPEFKADRFDPYKTFRFRVVMDGKTVAGVSRVGALTRTTQVVSFREGGDPSVPRKSPGQADYGAITLERGLTHDMDFARWANKVWDHANSTTAPPQATQLMSLKDFRKDIQIILMNEAGAPAIGFNVYRAWPSSYTGLPELDALGNAVAIQSLTLQCEGWEQEYELAEPDESSFILPAAAG